MKSNDTPSVSIVMPAYNSECYIQFSIESVLGQSFPDWELIIVDDCSSDHTISL
jgi:glycosyltransferase involved in cell wall biosynthesis